MSMMTMIPQVIIKGYYFSEYFDKFYLVEYFELSNDICLLSKHLGTNWTILHEGRLCLGDFDFDKKLLAANDPEHCREVAAADSECSDIYYHCSDNWACICLRNNGDSCQTFMNSKCTVERRGIVKSYLKNFCLKQ